MFERQYLALMVCQNNPLYVGIKYWLPETVAQGLLSSIEALVTQLIMCLDQQLVTFLIPFYYLLMSTLMFSSPHLAIFKEKLACMLEELLFDLLYEFLWHFHCLQKISNLS